MHLRETSNLPVAYSLPTIYWLSFNMFDIDCTTHLHISLFLFANKWMLIKGLQHKFAFSICKQQAPSFNSVPDEKNKNPLFRCNTSSKNQNTIATSLKSQNNLFVLSHLNIQSKISQFSLILSSKIVSL